MTLGWRDIGGTRETVLAVRHPEDAMVLRLSEPGLRGDPRRHQGDWDVEVLVQPLLDDEWFGPEMSAALVQEGERLPRWEPGAG